MGTDNRPFLCYYVSAYIFQAHILGYETLYSTIFNYPRIVGFFLSLSLRVLREFSDLVVRALREIS